MDQPSPRAVETPNPRRPNWRRLPRLQFSLATLLKLMVVVSLLLGLTLRHRNQSARLKRMAHEEYQLGRLDAFIAQLKIPDEALYWEDPHEHRDSPELDVGPIRMESCSRHGVTEFFSYARVTTFCSSNLALLSQYHSLEQLRGFEARVFGYERTLHHRARDACQALADSRAGGELGLFLRANPEIFEKRLRPLLLRLTSAPPEHGMLPANACAALLAIGDRSEPTLDAVQRLLRMPNTSEFLQWHYPQAKQRAVELNSFYELGLVVEERPKPTGTHSHSVQPAAGPIVPEYVTPPLLQSQVDVETLREDLQQRLATAIHAHKIDSRLYVTLDPILLPNACLTSGNAGGEMVVEEVRDNDGQRWLSPSIKSQRVASHGNFFGNSKLFVSLEEGGRDSQTGTLKITVPVVSAVRLFKFKAAGTQVQDEVRVTLAEINRNVASGMVKGQRLGDRQDPAMQFFAFDKTGRALKQGSWTGGKEHAHWFVDFKGEIEELWVALIGRRELVQVSVEFALHGTPEPQMPREPTADVRTRYEVSAFPDSAAVSQQALEQAEVEFVQSGSLRYDGYLRLKLDYNRHLSPQWEVNWFGKSTAVDIDGEAQDRDAEFRWMPDDLGDGSRPHLGAVFGKVRIQCPVVYEELSFAKVADGVWVADAASDVEVQFDHQILTFRAPPSAQLAVTAFDADGRRLKLGDKVDERRISGSKAAGATVAAGGEFRQYCWGQPVSCNVTVTRNAQKEIPFEIKFPPLDEEAYAKFKKRVGLRRNLIGAMGEIERATRDLPGMRAAPGVRSHPNMVLATTNNGWAKIHCTPQESP